MASPRAGRIGLVGCVKTKMPYPAPASELYASPLFRGRRNFVERTCDEWFILSAKHGLVAPGDVLEPYDCTLYTEGKAKKLEWSAAVVEQLKERIGDMSGVTFEVHASANYRDFGLTNGILELGGSVEIPTLGMNQGEHLRFYADANGPQRSAAARTKPATRVSATPHLPPARYEQLSNVLLSTEVSELTISFDEVDDLLPSSLPNSARKHSAWWANSEAGHSHAAAWLRYGWVAKADLANGTVTFRREESGP